MDGISAFPWGQPGFDPGGDGEVFEGVFRGGFPPDPLIHVSKSSALSLSPSVLDSSGKFKNPSLTDDLDQVLGDFDCLDSRLSRLQDKLERTLVMARWIGGDPVRKWWRQIAGRLRSCGSSVIYREYPRLEPGKQWKLKGGMFCQLPLLCPGCAGMRGSKHLRSGVAKVLQVMCERPGLVPMLFTGTLRNQSDLRGMYEKLDGFLKLLLHRRRNAGKGRHGQSVWSRFDGGIISIEVKRGSGSGLWHLHFHAVVLCNGWPMPDEVRAAWSEIVGYEAISDLRPLSCWELLRDRPGTYESQEALASDLMEVFKYACKFADMGLDDNFEAFKVLRGQRLVRAFGSLYGVDLGDDFLDCLKGLEAEPFVEYSFRLLGAGGTKRRFKVKTIQSHAPGRDPVELVLDPEEFPSIDGDYL